MIKLIIMVILSASLVAASTTCNQYCGVTSVLDRGVGASGSVAESAYYFYNNTYAPSVYITSTSSSCAVQLTITGNSLVINGTVIAIDGSNGFYIDYHFTATNGNNPLLELQPNQYVSNGGTIDPTQFSYFSLSQGTLTGFGTNQGVVLTMSEFMHPFMIGKGANGKNLNYGAAGWFSFTANGTVYQTDLNLDLTCYCDATTTCSAHGTCNSNDGTCICATGYTGSSCNQCATGYTGYPTCVVACDASTQCSGYGTCNGTQSCTCYAGYTGTNCNQCASGYYGYPNCVACHADTTCTGHGTCNGDGSCTCNTGYAGTNCNQCASSYFGYPSCALCDAATTCSSHGTCTATGGCSCNVGFTGTSCNQCDANYYNYPSCVVCSAATTCSSHGTCTTTGTCSCSTGFTGASCDQCSAGYSGYPACTTITGGVITSPTSTPVNDANMAAVASWCVLVAFMALFA